MARLSWYGYKYNLLIKWGFLPFEASDFAEQYTMTQLRIIPYLKNMTRWRRLYVSNLKSRGLTEDQIMVAILKLYDTKGWKAYDAKDDPWKMLKAFRKQAIDSGGYIPPKRAGSHHGVSKGDVAGQRRRRKQKVVKLRYLPEGGAEIIE